MPNRNYVNGAAKERRVVHKLKKQGYDIAIRSAGSKSPIDVIGIKKNGNGKNYIRLIQCKPKSMGNLQKQRLADELSEFDGTYIVETSVI